jgi:hypothetical protein
MTRKVERRIQGEHGEHGNQGDLTVALRFLQKDSFVGERRPEAFAPGLREGWIAGRG